MYPWLSRRLRLHTIPRREEVSDRVVVLSLAARFTDELLAGLPLVLMPTISARLALSLSHVGLLYQILNLVAGVVEPVANLLVDLVDRRWILTFGAVGSAVAVILMGLAPGFAAAAVAFAVVGLASGPLAHTADVVLIEAHPDAEDRISTRSVTIDTVGALLAPASVAAAVWLGVDWRALLVAVGGAALAYGVALARTAMPRPARAAEEEPLRPWREARTNLTTVLRDPSARRWLAAWASQEATDLAVLFTPLWLAREIGMSQGLVAAYVVVELLGSLAGLALLERFLPRWDGIRVLRAAAAGFAVLFSVWLLAPGGAVTRFALAVPLAVLAAPLWPILRARTLASVPGKAGAVMAVYSLVGLLPAAAAYGWLAERFGLTPVMLAVQFAALAVPLVLLRPGGRLRELRGGQARTSGA